MSVLHDESRLIRIRDNLIVLTKASQSRGLKVGVLILAITCVISPLFLFLCGIFLKTSGKEVSGFAALLFIFAPCLFGLGIGIATWKAGGLLAFLIGSIFTFTWYELLKSSGASGWGFGALGLFLISPVVIGIIYAVSFVLISVVGVVRGSGEAEQVGEANPDSAPRDYRS